jgi:hypothetical protein
MAVGIDSSIPSCIRGAGLSNTKALAADVEHLCYYVEHGGWG